MGQLTLWCKRSFFEGLIMEYGLVVGVDLVCLRLGCSQGRSQKFLVGGAQVILSY